MSDQPGVEDTVFLAAEHSRRFAFLRTEYRALAYRISADCERLMSEPHLSDRKSFTRPLGESLLAAKQLISLTASFASTKESDPGAEVRLNAEAQKSLQVIVTALSPLLTIVPVSVEEELALRDIRGIRDTARKSMTAPSTVQQHMTPVGVEAHKDGVSAGFRILVADDEAQLRELLRRHLVAMGHEVLQAENGADALDILKKERIDLILTDIDMPELDGLSLLQSLKSSEATRNIPVIVVSSQGGIHTVASVIEAGAEEHLVKPYEPVLLRARVRAVLERKRLRDVELETLRRVAALTEAAEAVENDTYQAGALAQVMDRSDEIAKLARVFDRMVIGLKSKQQRLEKQLGTLRREISSSESHINAVDIGEIIGEEAPKAAKVLSGRYTIEKQIGSGGMGAVFKAHDRELDEYVALKLIRPELIKGDPQLIERLKMEIRLARQISHPRVVRVHDLGESDGMYFVTMEYVKGMSVAELLDRRGRLTIESTLAIGTQLCEALAAAHEKHVIHRDIKPGNLMVDEEGGVKVMDFGIARSLKADMRLTSASQVIGTPRYMAPEQLLARQVDERADLFAVGVLLYECLTGRAPYEAETPIGLMADMLDENAPWIVGLVPDIPQRLAELVHQQLRFDPTARARSAAELARNLAEIEIA